MTIFYHSLGSGLTFSEVNPGDNYLGSEREYLSLLMGGKVGFAYAYLPKTWKGNTIYTK